MKFELIRTESIRENGNFVEKETVREVVDQEYLNNCIDNDTIKFFRAIGGTESIRRINGATGTITVVRSTSPCGMFNTVRRFTPIK